MSDVLSAADAARAALEVAAGGTAAAVVAAIGRPAVTGSPVADPRGGSTEAPSGGSTQAPPGSTEAPSGGSTHAPPGSTHPPSGGSTDAPPGSTQAPPGSTHPPSGSTHAPPGATADVPAEGAVRRMIVFGDGGTSGTLGDAPLDETAVRLGRAALRGDGSPSVETITLAGETWLLYVETHRPPERLVIVGAGHIAVPLAHIANLLGFRVTVLDDREEFATTERFDDDVAVQHADFATDPFAGVPLAEDTYVALVTRGHRWDFDCLQRLVALGARPRYIGMIGSRRRVRAAFRALLDAGVPREVLASIRAPIGLELQAETPVEIAVSIAAEMVAVRRGAEAGSISRRERVLDRFLNEE